MPHHWRTQISQSFKDPKDLLSFLDLDPNDFDLAASTFPFRVTQAFASRMQKGNPKDPLLLQVLPTALELLEAENFIEDPVMDLAASLAPGMIQKYAARVLLITTGACAIHCRYCFRREYPYVSQKLARSDLFQSLERIRDDPTIREVILSGGDPLALSNERILDIIDALSAIPHLQRIRLHSRLPIVLPDRIDAEILRIFKASRPKIVIVIHSNHPNEIDHSVQAAILELHSQGISLLNQSVLLRGINDDASVLIRLSEELFAMGVLPYYLHELDRARGTTHFETREGVSKELIEAMRSSLPGYLVPRLVREIPGAPSKTLIA